MLLLRQMVHNLSERTSLVLSRIKTEYDSRSHVVQNYPYRESLGVMLSALVLLVVTIAFLIAIFISSLLLLTATMLTKLLEQLKNIATLVWSALCTQCPWVADMMSTKKMHNESQDLQWNEAGAIPQDYTLTSSETHGEPKYKNDQHKRAMTAPVWDEEHMDRIRRSGI